MLRTGRFFGDVNGDCVFDVKDVRRASLLLSLSPATDMQPWVLSLQPYVSQVRRASLLLLDQPRGATTVPTAYHGAGLCSWQQQQLEPTLDGK